MSGSMVRSGKTADGRQKWRLRCYAGLLPSGRSRYRERRFVGTAGEAAVALQELVNQVSSGAPNTDPTLDELVMGWIERSEPAWAAGSGEKTRRRWELHGSPRVGRLRVSRVTTRDLALAYQAMISGGLSPASVHRVHASVHSALGEAVRWGVITHNPAAGARPKAARTVIQDPPPPEMIARVLQQIRSINPEYGRWFELAAVTGARRSEIAGLRWTDIDFESGVLQILRTFGEHGFATTKTGHGRTIQLDIATVATLQEQRSTQVARLAAKGLELAANGSVFADFNGGEWQPWRTHRVTQWWSRHREALGVPNMRLHDFRHWAATQMVAAGVPIREVSSHLGHAKTSTTLDVYGHRAAHGSLAASTLRAALGG